MICQDETFVRHCSFERLRPQLPLPWPSLPHVPHSPRFDLVLRLVDFNPLRPVLAWLLGWTSARGRVPFDPLPLFLSVSWQIVNDWSRTKALRLIRDPPYADYAACFGFHEGDFPTEGARATS